MDSQKSELKIAIISIVALILLIVALPLSTVGAEAPPLTFDTLSKQPEFADNPDGSTKLQVITSPPPERIVGISSADQSVLDTIDYANYIVVIAFFGYGSLLQEGITNIWQFRDAVWIRSLYSTADSSATIKFSPYHIIKIDKTQMHQYGRITFRLLSGYDQKAEIVQTISPPVSQINPQ